MRDGARWERPDRREAALGAGPVRSTPEARRPGTPAPPVHRVQETPA
ncbi:hypothetical protein LUW77_23070 [Streptomyces radiopugnans]|nr:hypothetical protein LUW77_23070 [Streptomyces radiopugnans]